MTQLHPGLLQQAPGLVTIRAAGTHSASYSFCVAPRDRSTGSPSSPRVAGDSPLKVTRLQRGKQEESGGVFASERCCKALVEAILPLFPVKSAVAFVCVATLG